MRSAFKLYQVNKFGETIDYVNREFKSREDASEYQKRFCKSGRWEIRECVFIPVYSSMTLDLEKHGIPTPVYKFGG